MKKIVILLSVLFITGSITAKDINTTSQNATGGPEATYGYTWLDSDEAELTYSWEEISVSGTDLVPGIDADNYTSVDFPIGFDFPGVNDAIFSTFSFNADGVVFLNNGTQSMELAFCETDLKMLASNSFGPASVHYELFADHCVIQFDNITNYETFNEEGDMQVVLYKSGNIEYRYNRIINTLYAMSRAYVGLRLLGSAGVDELMVRADENITSANWDDTLPIPPSIIATGNSIMFVYPGPVVPVSVYSVLGLFLIIGLVTVYKIYR